MFEKLIKELKTLEKGVQIRVPIESDENGYLDRECPDEKCLFQFKVHEDDWAEIKESNVNCPACKHQALGKSWYTQQQVEMIREYGQGFLANRINGAMKADAKASKKKSRKNSFFSLTLETKGGRNAILLPIEAAESMVLQTSCDDCGCRYSFIGAAYFCPKCGHNSAQHMFAQTIHVCRTSANVEDSLNASFDKDTAASLVSSLLEKALQDMVTAFQRLNEQLYSKVSTETPRRNAFQNLSAGSELWKSAIDQGYAELLTSNELAQMAIYFQQRHLLAHQQGIVDEDYIRKSGDDSYQAGQRIIVKKNQIWEFADLIEKLGNALINSKVLTKISNSTIKE